jgi:hypothetical protein
MNSDNAMERLTRKEMIALVERLMRGEGDEAEAGEWIEQLARSLPNPHIGQIIFWPEPDEQDLTAEQIVDKAMRYRPFAL